MDIEVFGIRLSKFITAFKDSYGLGNGEYDYMSFLQVTDCASHCGMLQTYTEPNRVLNVLISPTLNSIEVISGGSKRMTGGSPKLYIFILVLFVLAVSKVYSDTESEFLTAYGPDPRKWPIYPGDGPKDRWFLFFFNLGPDPTAVTKYNQDLEKWNEFRLMQESREIEREHKKRNEQRKSEADLVTVHALHHLTSNSETSTRILHETYEALRKAEREREFYRGLLIGGGTVIGLLFSLVVQYRNEIRERVFHIDRYGRRIDYIQNQPDYQRLIAIDQYGRQVILRGGKTKSHKKKGTRRY